MNTIKVMATYCALAIVCTFAYSNVQAHNDISNKLIGNYDVSGWKTDKLPIGFQSLTLFENKRYLLIGMYETLIGDWQVTEDKNVYLSPDNVTYPFTVYGRYNDQLNHQTTIYFNGVYFSNQTFINLNDVNTKNLTLKPIKLNSSNNDTCERTHSNATLPNKYNNITLAYNSELTNKDEKEILIYTYENPLNYNEFIIRSNLLWIDRPPMKLKISDNSLQYKGKKAIKVSGSEGLNTDPELLKKISEKIPSIPEITYQSRNYQPFIIPKTSENYRFDDSINAYVPKTKPNEADIFYQYNALDDIKVQLSTFKVDATTFNYSRCL